MIKAIKIEEAKGKAEEAGFLYEENQYFNSLL